MLTVSLRAFFIQGDDMKKLIIFSVALMLIASLAHAGYYTTKNCHHCGSSMTVYVYTGSNGYSWGYNHTCGHSYSETYSTSSCSHCSNPSCVFGRMVIYQSLWSGGVKTGTMQTVTEHSTLCGWNAHWVYIW